MANVSNWSKLNLLLWKNWKLKSGHLIGLVIEVLLPVVFALLLVYIRSTVKSEPVAETRYNESVEIDNLALFKNKSNPLMTQNLKLRLIMTPPNQVLEKIVKTAAGSLYLEGVDTAPNVSTLETMCITTNYFAGVVFDQNLEDLTDINDLNKFDFTLRFPSELRTSRSKLLVTWETNRLFPIFEMPGPRNAKDPGGGIPPGYLAEGFLPLQNALSRTYLQMRSGENDLPHVQMWRYPYPAYINDPLLEGLGDIMAFLLLVSFIYPCVNITKDVATEKEKQLKEIMKIMGLNGWLHWVAWFIKSFLLLAVSCVFVVLCFKIEFGGDVSVLTYSDFSVIYVFMLIYLVGLICFCFLMSTFFAKASTAAAVSGLLLFVVYVPYSFLAQNDQVPASTKLGWSLFINSAMGFGFKVIITYEGTGEGMQWRNLFTPPTVDDDLTLGAIMLMMLAAAVIYMILCLYIEKISPGDYGLPAKWYFPFTSEFWCGSRKTASIDDIPRNMAHQEQREGFEPEPEDKHVGVQVLNLRKQFGKKVAVKGVSVNMYEDEITVLLGHNGAGKTTTISMLTGIYPPTSGTAIINGSDIRTNTKGARMSLGICPQHNVLFDSMTVEDHIIFFSRLKGLTGSAIKKEVEKYLKLIGLEDKARKASKTLSGGMKRKLSLCCALCGGTKVVLCDEPSSGLDPAARRQLWNLLQTEKTGRTILLTTHFMDEADVLGDRIAIMCDGEVKCAGSSFFLKKKYGSGYRLICVKEPNCKEIEVTTILRKHIPDIEPESNIGSELSYQMADDDSGKFEAMFRDLEENSMKLHISGYGIGITSLEEVFMKVGSENAADGTRLSSREILRGGTGFNDDVESTKSDGLFSETKQLKQGMSLMVSQWKGMLLKKCLYTYRNWIRFLIQNILPIFFMVITILVAKSTGGFIPMRSMKINLTQYPQANVVLDTSVSPPANSLAEKSFQKYQELFSSYGSNYGFETTNNLGFEEYILNKGESLQVRINARYVASATFNSTGNITAWLNNQPLHTAPLTVNMVYNSIARALIENQTVGIGVTNYPLPYTLETMFMNLESGNNLGTQVATNICFAMCFVTAFYILFLIKERDSRAKLLQFVSGVRVWTFWLTQFLFDYATFIITAFLTVCTLACFQEKGYSSFVELGRIFFVLLLFAISALPYTYVLSFWFKEPASGFAKVSFINLLAGLALFLVVMIMSLPFYDTKHIADILKWIFMVFPHFSLASSMNNLYSNNQLEGICEQIKELVGMDACPLYKDCCDLKSFIAWDSPGILPEITYFLVTGFIFFFILIVYEFGLINELIYKIKALSLKPPEPPSDNLDDDVKKEHERISRMSEDQIAGHNLVLDRVTKYYGKFIAVNQISLCVERLESFGLLGVNGAGKTTTFKMLTGDERITFGEAYVRGISLKTQITDVYQEIGYCPQFDALLDDLTGRETLKIFCLLRGVPEDQISSNSEELAKSFGFMKHMDKHTKAYSGGNKRKLSAAIACIGNPSVIYMDEPTSGIDPAARRQLWNMLCRIRDSGKSIVLTSHSMEECEAICTRLAIMVNGEFKCIGSTQHLKNKFSKGLVLKVKVRKEVRNMKADEKSVEEQFTRDIENIKNFIMEKFPDAELKEQYQGILTFYIPLMNIKWSAIFGVMENNRDALNIEDYSVSQTTLEEIFLEFAATQRETRQEVKKKKRKGCLNCLNCCGSSEPSKGPQVVGS